MARVYNKHREKIPEGAVYVGRGTPFGNPFRIRSGVCTRDMAVAQFREYLTNDKDLQRRVRSELRGRDLVCFCKPKPCHGDVLLEFANADEAPSGAVPTDNPAWPSDRPNCLIPKDPDQRRKFLEGEWNND